MDAAFYPGIGEDCRLGRIAHSHYDWRTSRVTAIGEEVVSHFGVYDLEMRIGISRARTAGVNLVATHPEHARHGHMGRTTRAALGAMRTNGYALSIICNAEPDLYGRYGFVYAWPETAWTIQTQHLPADPPPALTEFVPGTRPEVWDLYNQEHATLTGTVMRPTFVRLKTPRDPGHGFAWTDASGAFAGYVIADKHVERSWAFHDDSAGDPHVRLRVLAHLARDWGCESVRITRQPWHSPLIRAVRHLTCHEERRYARDGRWLVRVIDAARLFDSLSPELTRRLRLSQFAHWSGSLAVQHYSESLTLAVRDGEVRLDRTAADAAPRVLRADAALGQLAIGARSVGELLHARELSVSDDAHALIDALFPEQHPQMSDGDL